MWQDLTFWQQVGVIMLWMTAVLGLYLWGDSQGGWYIVIDDYKRERAKKKAKGGASDGR